jgi:hypothetical protein
MEMSQGNNPYSYLKQTKMSFFSFTIMENRKEKQVFYVGLAPVGRGEDIRKGCMRVNMVDMLCTHICKFKNETY